MRQPATERPAPWRRSVDEPHRRVGRHVTVVELIAVIVVIAAIVVMSVWFLFLATGGPGPGTV